MKKQSFNTIFAIVLSSFIFVSCNNDDDNGPQGPNADTFTSLSALIDDLKPDTQTFELDPTTGGTITGDDGTIIEINPNAFTDDNDDPITTTITVKLKEYLTVKNMFMANIQTLSNGQLLVTGGSFDLTFEDENGNDVNISPWDIQSKIPIQTNIPAEYENTMQYFVGEVTTDDGKEVVNWTQGQAEFWMDEEGFFNTLGVEQGLSNCDVLYNMVGETPTQFEVTVTGVTDYSQATVWMFIEDFPSIVVITSLNDAEDALETYANSIPTGLNATLVAMTVDEDSYLKFGSLAITVAGDDTFNVDVDYGTTEELSALIDSIVD